MDRTDSIETMPLLPQQQADHGTTRLIIYLLIGYMWIFLNRPSEVWPTRLMYNLEHWAFTAVTVVWWYVAERKPVVPNRLHRRFGLFILVILASWWLSPFRAAGNGIVGEYLKYAFFYVVLLSSVRSERDLHRIVAGYILAMTVWMLHSLREYHFGHAIYAQGVNRLVPVGSTYDCNDFAGLIVCSLPLAWVLWRQWGGWWRGLLAGYFGLGCYCITLTASRMGFAGTILFAMWASWISPKRWRILAFSPLLLAAVFAMLPEDRRTRYLSLFDPSAGPAEAAASAGRFRVAGFEKALPLLAERPLLGFGPNTFGEATGTAMMPHNLYGQLLAELGIAGALAFGLILLGVVQNARAARRIAREMAMVDSLLPWHTVMAASAAIGLLAIMGWGFNFLFWHVWLWFGAFQVLGLYCLEEQAALAAAGETVAMEQQCELREHLSWEQQPE